MFIWTILDIIAQGETILGVRYKLSLSDGKYTVESEAEHLFKNGTVNLPYADIKEYNLIDWVKSDTNEDNLLQSNLENQLNSLQNSLNNKMPWLANTFTPGV
jgi:transcriptional regulatory protein LevR